MPAEEIHNYDIGTVFEGTIMDGTAVVDISTATTMEMTFKKPSGATVIKTATFTTDGIDGKMQYTTIANDLDEEGNNPREWSVQGRVVLATGEWNTDIHNFTVYPNL